ncbi:MULTISPECIES: methionyl-tRNA formyltransferase [Campylobacter]|uniref:methionyl-tRNA formyltransferase n=1 Tax=Campylobacter TaxID=194 RepID=UPI00147041BA|nr:MULTISPECIES: methionyl-tRNA formyltransferase [Campylobacter]MBN7288239.1 methionyl-tRNA formyltransferase [Campylobacter curvus]MDU6827066.1 methionyl-tRNA formyltransferase [Campylobacter sp.]
MNIIFMGTPAYARVILDALVRAGIGVTGIFTQPDKPVGRKQILTPSEVKIYAQQNLPHTKIFQPRTLKEGTVTAEILALKPDFIVVAAYGKILPKSILDIAPCINLHASILPKYRGASPIQAALLNGEKNTGVTAMLMDEGLDTGDMLGFTHVSCEGKRSAEMFEILGELAGKLAVKTLFDFKNLTPQKQDDALATHCKKIQKSDGLVNLSEDAEQIYNKFRAFHEWPGIFLESGLKFLELNLADGNGAAGEILRIEKDGFVMACGMGALKILALQEAGKKALDAKAYINGKRLVAGNKIS